MQLTGRYRVEAARETVWTALNDTDVLGQVIPGCEKIEWVGPADLEIAIKVNLGLMHPVFTGDLQLSNVVPAERYTLSGRGRGGLLGKVEAAADITLSDAGDGATILAFAANGGGSGRIMALGKSVIGNSAQKLVDGFFEQFGQAMGARVTPMDAS